MTRTHATRRPGLSVLEVMTAMFVAALGMLSLLSLFPLGAVQMGQALRDARAAETVAQADTHMRLWWQRDVVERTPGAEDRGFNALDNPNNTFDGAHPFGTVPVAATDTNPSYPLAVDALGWQARNGLGTRQSRLAGGAAAPTNGLLPRRSLDWVLGSGNPAAFSFRVATMMDDLTFNQVALPYNDDTVAATNAALAVDRQGRYNWLAIVQRPVNANRHVADLKVAVFDARPPGIAPIDAEQVFAPTGGSGVGSSQIVLNVGAANRPEYLKAGSWVLDGTLTNTGVRNAVWYRLQAIDKDTLPNAYILDLQTPLVRPVGTGSQIYTFKGLLEVFDRPQLAPPGYKKQSP